MDPLSLLVTSYTLYASVRDNLATVQSNKNQFELLGDRVEELEAPIRKLQDMQRATNKVPCSEKALKNLNRTLNKIDSFIRQKRFRRKSGKLNPLHFISDVYHASDDQQTFLEFNSLLCSNLQGLNLGISVSLLDFATAASKDQVVTNQSAALVDVQAKALELRGLEYNPNDTSNKLGQGGFSTVRSGKYNGQAVAIKHVQQLEHFSPKDLKMINKEALVMQFADHPNIVKLKGVSLQQGLLVMELAACALNDILHPVDGVFTPRAQTVKVTMGSTAASKLAWKMQVIKDISDAVSYLHTHHILHRDIKSANVMLFLDAASGRTVAKIGDFGLALAVDLVSRTAGGTAGGSSPNQKAAGTYNYMAPELFDRQPGESVAYSEATDVFSVGILINEIMTEQVPWGGTAREFDVLMWVLHQQLRPDPWDRSLTSSLPLGDALYDLVGDNERPHSCLHQLPAQRPSAEEILQVTSRCGGSAPPSPVPVARAAAAANDPVLPPKPPKPVSAPVSTPAPAPVSAPVSPVRPPAARVADPAKALLVPVSALSTLPSYKKTTFKGGDVYEGQWVNDMRNGQGVNRFADGGEHAGMYKDNKREGFGVYKFADGRVYEGQWKSDKMDGRGMMTYTTGTVYDGQWHENVKEGLGTWTLQTGETYTGQWSKDMRNGQGTNKFADGGQHTGLYKDNQRCGHGTFKFADGRVYEGQWLADKMDGHGIMKSVNGDVFDGQWTANNKEGHGVMKYATGTVYDGQWHENVKEGLGTWTLQTGETYTGLWTKDMRNGQGTNKFADGGQHTGLYKDNQRCGHGVFKFADGRVYEGQWQSDKMHGRGVMKYTTGTVYDGQWKENFKEGLGTWTLQTGETYTGQWANDMRNGPGTNKFADGSMHEGQYKDNKREGYGTFKFADGRVYEGQWMNDTMHGHGVMKYANGTVYDGQWKDNNKV